LSSIRDSLFWAPDWLWGVALLLIAAICALIAHRLIFMADAREGAMELRALVSARSAADAFELRCEVREKLIEFLQTEYPTALRHARAETVASQQARQERESPVQEQRAARGGAR